MGRRKSGSKAIEGLIKVIIGLAGIFIVIIIQLIRLIINLISQMVKNIERKKYLNRQEHLIRTFSIDNIDSMDGIRFEHYVACLLSDQGYNTNVTKGSGDFGVDIIANKNDIRYSVQVKRYNSRVSRHAVSDAIAGKKYYECNAAMVVTNSYFTEAAIKYASKTECKLIDRDILADWIIDFKNSQDNIEVKVNNDKSEINNFSSRIKWWLFYG